MRKNISYCHPSFSLENVKGSSNYKIIKSGRSLDLAYQLGAMTIKGLTPPAPSYIRGGEKGEYSYIRGGVMGIIAMTMISLFSFNVQAECTPTPDCASIGYTETSCEGASLKCPFDITKMMCMPCDSSFRYDCTGDNITGGTGSACGGKYVSCECSAGSVFKNGACACDDSCTVGAIYYSDGTCSACVDSNKTAIGVVVKDNELVMSQIRSTAMSWSSNYANVSGITETTDSAVAKQDFNGKANTLAIIATFTSDTVDNNAAINCNSYSTAGTNAGDWYLPAAGELYSYVYGGGTNYSKINTTMGKLGWTFGGRYFWSSSEYLSNHAWTVHSSDGYMTSYSKDTTGSVSCFLAIN